VSEVHRFVCVPLDRYGDEWTLSANGSSMFGDGQTKGAVMRFLIVDKAFSFETFQQSTN
jgi:hypothetical protein